MNLKEINNIKKQSLISTKDIPLENKQQSSKGNFARGSTMKNQEKSEFFKKKIVTYNDAKFNIPSLCLQQSNKHDNEKSLEEMKEYGCIYQDSIDNSMNNKNKFHTNHDRTVQDFAKNEKSNKYIHGQTNESSNRFKNEQRQYSASTNHKSSNSQMNNSIKYCKNYEPNGNNSNNYYDKRNNNNYLLYSQDINSNIQMLNRDVYNSHTFRENQLTEFNNYEAIRMMNDMMTSMMSFQQTNFQIMVNSHTQIMSKLIDKKSKNILKRKNKSNMKSSTYESQDIFEN